MRREETEAGRAATSGLPPGFLGLGAGDGGREDAVVAAAGRSLRESDAECAAPAADLQDVGDASWQHALHQVVAQPGVRCQRGDRVNIPGRLSRSCYHGAPRRETAAGDL